jgi:hypothetical protein
MHRTEEQLLERKIKKGKLIKWLLIGIGVIILFFIYKVFSPYEQDFFPKCIFLQLTGYKCPGCGSQRAVHYLFNLDICHALKENLLLVISIPYLILGAWFDMVTLKTERQFRIRKMLYGQRAIMVILVIVIGFWILRNVF